MRILPAALARIQYCRVKDFYMRGSPPYKSNPFTHGIGRGTPPYHEVHMSEILNGAGKVHAMEMATIAGQTVPVMPKLFSTGSVGWFAQAKVVIQGERVQLQITATIIGSKLPPGTTTISDQPDTMPKKAPRPRKSPPKAKDDPKPVFDLRDGPGDAVGGG